MKQINGKIEENEKNRYAKMGKKLEIVIKITDENGETLVSQSSEREVPYIEEVTEQGFRAAFHEYETAVLESRKEVSDQITGEYFELISKKKPNLKPEPEKILRQNGIE